MSQSLPEGKFKWTDIPKDFYVMSFPENEPQGYILEFDLGQYVSTVFLKIHVRKNSHYLETNQLICIDSNLLAGFYTTRFFSERYFRKDYIHTHIDT